MLATAHGALLAGTTEVMIAAAAGMFPSLACDLIMRPYAYLLYGFGILLRLVYSSN